MATVAAIVMEEVTQCRDNGDLDRDDVRMLGIFLRNSDDGGASRLAGSR